MTTAYTSLLGLALPVTGELSGTWGDTVNNAITSLLDSAVAGTTTLSTDADVTLTTTSGAANQAREAILLCSGARTGIKTITAPAQSKIYTIINATTGGYAVKIVGAGPTTGLTIPNGSSAVIAWNGSDFIEIGSGTIGNLTVNGNLTVTGTSTLTGAITNTAATANGVMYANGSKVLTTGSALVFDGTNLGVGVTPTQKLDVYTAAAANVVLFRAGSGQNSFLSVIGNGNTFLSTSFDMIQDSSNLASLVQRANAAMAFSTNNTERLRLDASGNLGLGTASPSTYGKFAVSGADDAALLGLSSATGVLRARAYNTATTGAVIEATNAAQSAYANLFLNGLNLLFGTGNTERMRLDSSGNLGLGVTPSAWNSAWRAIQIGAGANFVGRTGVVNQLQLIANGYYNGTNYIYQNTGEATQYFQTGGYHAWGVAASGTAGNAITFTQAMTLDASGNLGIGTTSPAAKLDIGANDSTAKTISLRYSSIPSYYSSTFDGTYGLNTISINTYNTSSGSTSWSAFSNTAYGAAAIQLASQNGGANFIRFLVGTAANTTPVETARLDASGNLFVGATALTSNANYFAYSPGNTFADFGHITGVASGTSYTRFLYGGGVIGSITQSGTTAVLYNTTSDQRLKENIVDAPEFGSVIDSIQVRSYDWKSDHSHQRAGFIAQELVTVAPEAVHQPADPDDMMAVDYSKLVPMLVKEIQSLRKRLTALEGKA